MSGFHGILRTLMLIPSIPYTLFEMYFPPTKKRQRKCSRSASRNCCSNNQYEENSLATSRLPAVPHRQAAPSSPTDRSPPVVGRNPRCTPQVRSRILRTGAAIPRSPSATRCKGGNRDTPYSPLPATLHQKQNVGPRSTRTLAATPELPRPDL